MKYFFIFALATIFLCGCGPVRPKTVPVNGKITYFGGEWPNSGDLYFAPEKSADGYSLRPASGKLAKDGSFEVMSFEPGDGLVPGKYLVTIQNLWLDDSKLLYHIVDVDIARGDAKVFFQTRVCHCTDTARSMST